MYVKRAFITAVAAVFALSACGGGWRPVDAGHPDRARRHGGSAAASSTVVVGSFNFPESVLLGSIYAQALQAKGVTVEEKPNIGSREVVFDQVKSGGLTVLPEYIGSLLAFVDPAATAKSTDDVVAALKTKLPPEVEVLTRPPRRTATPHGHQGVRDREEPDHDRGPGEDLQGPQGRRPAGVQGAPGGELQGHLRPGVQGVGSPRPRPRPTPSRAAPSRSATSSPPTRRSCSTTWSRSRTTRTPSPPTTSSPLVFKSGVDDTVKTTLDAVSAKLTTEGLLELMKRIAVDKDRPARGRQDWLTQNGLI